MARENPNTMLWVGLGVLAAVGIGAYFLMQKQQPCQPLPTQLQAGQLVTTLTQCQYYTFGTTQVPTGTNQINTAQDLANYLKGAGWNSVSVLYFNPGTAQGTIPSGLPSGFPAITTGYIATGMFTGPTGTTLANTGMTVFTGALPGTALATA